MPALEHGRRVEDRMVSEMTTETLKELIKNVKIVDPRPYTPLFTSAAYDAWKREYWGRTYPETETTDEFEFNGWEPIKKIDFNKSAVFTVTSDKPINMEMLGFETNQTAISLSSEDIEEVSESLFDGV